MQLRNQVYARGKAVGMEFETVGSGDKTFRKASFRLPLPNTGAKKNDAGYYESSWVGVEALGKTAEILEESFSEGSEVEVLGEIKVDSWEKDGERKSKTYIKANRASSLRGSSSASASGGSSESEDEFALADDELPPF